MSEPTNAEMAEQEDWNLDRQIDAWYEAHHQPVNPSIEDALSIFPLADALMCVPPILVEVEE